MSKAATRRAERAEFLGAKLAELGEKARQAELKKYEPPPYKHGFIVKPTNPTWIAALERKVRQYKTRVDEKPWDYQTRYRLILIKKILRDGEVNLEAAALEAESTGIRFHSLSDRRESESIVQLYCRLGSHGCHSWGGFLPTDPDYDETV